LQTMQIVENIFNCIVTLHHNSGHINHGKPHMNYSSALQNLRTIFSVVCLCVCVCVFVCVSAGPGCEIHSTASHLMCTQAKKGGSRREICVSSGSRRSP